MVSAGLIFLWSIILFILVPIDMEAVDSGAADACNNASSAPNSFEVPGEPDCADCPLPDCAAAFAAAKPFQGDKDDADEAKAAEMMLSL